MIENCVCQLDSNKPTAFIFPNQDLKPLKVDEVRVKMHFASLNYRDLLTVRGLSNVQLPMIPLSDGSGVVIEVGSQVKDFSVGDKVASCFFSNWLDGPATQDKIASAIGTSLAGVAQDYYTCREDALIKLPQGIDLALAACLPCAALTAWVALKEANVDSSKQVLIQGSGGVALFALQFAKYFGAECLAITSSDKKATLLHQLGAAEIVRYDEEPKWGKSVLAASREGVDVVIDTVGNYQESLRCLKIGGHIAAIGNTAGLSSEIKPIFFFMKHVHLRGHMVGSKASFQRMLDFILNHHIDPCISHRFFIRDIAKAFEYMESKQHTGKILIVFNEDDV